MVDLHSAKLCLSYCTDHALDRRRIRALQSTIGPGVRSEELRQFFEKAMEQVDIVESSFDAEALEAAIASFENLQHIRVMRVVDWLDTAFLSFLRRNRHFAGPDVQLEWEPVSLRAAGTLGRAVLSRNSPATRWSFLQVDTQTAITFMQRSLMDNSRISVSSIAQSLQCLTLRFESPDDLDAKMRELSPLFRTVFESARNLVSVHIGFLQTSVSIPLSDIFHGIKMENLRVFSIAGWRLNAEEIIDLCHTYRANLRGLRLHGVLLKEGGMWKDVLATIRKEMQSLRWISLSKADYATAQNGIATGVDVTRHSDSDESDTADEEEDEENEDSTIESEETADPEPQGEDSDDLFSNDDDPRANSDVDSIDDRNGTARAFTIEVETPDYEHICTCSSGIQYLSVDDLRDDGISVTQRQRKLWESWVVGCLVHGRGELFRVSNTT